MVSNNDPAFLLYSSDFLTGTIFMTNEQLGKYIKLLCLQHQKGRLTKEQFFSICDDKDLEVSSKFSIAKNGLFYNKRLEVEIEKRNKFAESRRINGSKGGRPSKPSGKPSGKPKHNHSEDENEDVIKDNSVSFLSDEFLGGRKGMWIEWLKYKRAVHGDRYKTEKGEKMQFNKFVRFGGNKRYLNSVIENEWKGFYEIKQEKNKSAMAGTGRF